MANNNVVDILKGVVGELREIAKSETVIGEAVTIAGRTVIPVVKVSVGFGAGGGQGESEKTGAGFGGGGGGGARIEPVAFIILDESGASLLPVSKGKWEGIIDSIPGLAKKISKLKDKLKTDEDDKSKDDDSEKETKESKTD